VISLCNEVLFQWLNLDVVPVSSNKGIYFHLSIAHGNFGPVLRQLAFLLYNSFSHSVICTCQIIPCHRLKYIESYLFVKFWNWMELFCFVLSWKLPLSKLCSWYYCFSLRMLGAFNLWSVGRQQNCSGLMFTRE